jgi:O-antigen ligase
MVLMALAAVCGLIWLLILLYFIIHRGFTVLLLWLLVAPIMLNIIYKPFSNPLFGQVGKKPAPRAQELDAQDRAKKKAAVAQAADKGASIRLGEVLEPTRTLFVLFLAVFIMEVAVRRKRLLPLDKTEMWMLAFVSILILSALFQSRRTGNSLRVAVDAFFIPFLAYYITRRLVTGAENYRRLVLVIGYLGLYLIGVAVLERLTVSGLLYRLSGPFNTDNQLYAVLVAVLFMMLGETGAGRSGEPPALPHWLRWSVILLIPPVIFGTWARSNWLGFFAGAWVFMFFARRLVPISQKVAVIGLILLLVPMAGVAVQALTSVEGVEERVTRTTSIYARIAAWQIVTQKGLENPIFGIGLKNAESVLTTERTSYKGVKNETDAHNGFLTIFAEHGIPGLLSYGAIAFTLLQLGLDLYRRGIYPQDKWRGISVMALLAAYLTPVLTTTILQVPSLCHSYAFACLGGVAGLYTASRQKAGRPVPTAVATGYRGDRRPVLH